MRNKHLLSLLLLPLLLSGCWSGTTEYEGICYPECQVTEVTFQESTIPDSCFVFAHLQMATKAHATGKDIEEAMLQEARSKGANLILVGLARELLDADLEENQFTYFGPDYSYKFTTTWLGWKFGFDEWNDADDLTSFGANNWDDGKVRFDNSLLIQAVFLHCGEQSNQ